MDVCDSDFSVQFHFHFVIGYLHPDGKNRICDLHYYVFRLREQELQEYSKRHLAPPPALERLFISFKYETGVTAPGLPKRVDRHLPLLCPFEQNETHCEHPKVSSIRFPAVLQHQITTIFPRVDNFK